MKRNRKTGIWKSMRVHVFAALLFVGMVPLYFGVLRLGQVYENRALKQRQAKVQAQAAELADTVLQTGYLSNPNQPETTAQLQTFAELYGGRIIVVDGGLVIRRDTFGREEGKTLISEEAILALRGRASTYYNRAGGSVELAVPILQGGAESAAGTLIVAFSVEDILRMESDLRKNTGAVLLLAFLLISAAAAVLSRHMAKPFSEIAASIRHITDGYMDERVAILGCTEVEQIAEAFNHMLEQMKAVEDSRQEFVANVSHELKTPLASIKVLADSLLTQPDAPLEMYREFMADINSEIERETKIVNDLLSLVKLDRTAGEMHIAEVSINELIEIIMNRLKPLAVRRGIEMVFESYRTVLAEVDEVKMSLVFTNLVENAIKYNRDGGYVKVSLNADHKYFYVKVEDSGVGIPPEEQKLIFDRFYRVDKARSRETGGTGLGLSIAKSAVLMHKGVIRADSREGEGAVLSIRVPLSFIP